MVGTSDWRVVEHVSCDRSDPNCVVDVFVKIVAKASQKGPMDGKDGQLFFFFYKHGQTVKVRDCKGEEGNSGLRSQETITRAGEEVGRQAAKVDHIRPLGRGVEGFGVVDVDTVGDHSWCRFCHVPF